MKTLNQLTKITGDLAVDDRGIVRFVNEFDFKKIRRFYQVENFNQQTIRAFHGHKKGAQYVYVVSGSALVCAVFLNNLKNPSKENKVEKFVLSDKKPQILYIPPSFANGFKVLEENTIIIFYSTLTIGQVKKDDFRFPFDYWGEDVWKIENR